MKFSIEKLASLYAEARYTIALDEKDGRAVTIGMLWGAKRDCRTLEAVFPQLTDLSFSHNERTRQWDVSYGDDFFRQHSYSYPAAAVNYAETVIHGLFEDLPLAAGSSRENRPGAEEGNTPTSDDLPPGVAARYRPAHFPLPPRAVTCPHCGKIPLEK